MFLWIIEEMSLMDSINHNPLITFNDTGTYLINLHIINNNGCRD